MTDTITLMRSGQPLLRFRGKLLAEASSQQAQGPTEKRWHELRVYRTAGGKLVLQVQFRSDWPEDVFVEHAVVVTDNLALAKAMAEFSWQAGWIGHPPGSRDADHKNSHLRQSIGSGYQHCVNTLLDTLGIVEEVD